MKKLFVILLVFVISFSAFAQSAASTGLTDSDVKSFCKNFSTIKAELDKLGVDVQDTDSLASAESAKAKAISILNKNGISGNNAFEKVAAIGYGYAIEGYESTLAADPQAAKMIQSMGIDPIADVRAKIAPSDLKVVKNHYPEVKKAFEEDDDSPATSQSSSNDSYDMAALQQYQNMLANSGMSYEDSDTKARKEVLKKYDVKKKFNVLKDNDGSEWILIKPSDITFANSTEAEIYAENYVGVSGDWSMCSSCGYLGRHPDGKPFYTWGDDGILCYEKFPIDYESCAPDRIIEDADVTPAMAKKAVLQLYKY